MLPNKNFGGLPAGSFTDDTSMALCLANSLIENDGATNTGDQVYKYLQWCTYGYMSVNGKCFDIGSHTRQVLQTWEQTLQPAKYLSMNRKEPKANKIASDIQNVIIKEYCYETMCGNGSLMRVAPVALMVDSPSGTAHRAKESSMTTHPHIRCQEACMVYCELIWKALSGACKDGMISALNEFEITDKVLEERLSHYKTPCDWAKRTPSGIKSSGYVVDSLEAVLWAFWTTETFEEGAIKVVNLGDDADTVGAIFGGLAGAFYGIEQIPKRWLAKMKGMEMVDGAVAGILKFRGLPVEKDKHPFSVGSPDTVIVG